MQDAKLTLTEAWDKVFPKSDLVDHEKVTFHNRYGITLAADLYKPKGAEGKTLAEKIVFERDGKMFLTMRLKKVTHGKPFSPGTWRLTVPKSYKPVGG